MLARLALALVGALIATAAGAEPADIVKVEILRTGDTYRFDVTVRHANETPEHFVNRWEIVGPDDAILGTRVLLQAHPDEQPFTRSLGGVRIPDGVRGVVVRAHETEQGYGGKNMTVSIPR